MTELPLQMTDHPAETDWQRIEDNINQFNIQLTGYDDYRPLAIFACDAAGAIMAGLTAFSWGGTLRVVALWVHEDWRKHGYGTQLLAAAEKEALARGCQQVILETHSFQAPLFYRDKGYTTCGVIEDYPAGFQHISLQKRLNGSLQG